MPNGSIDTHTDSIKQEPKLIWGLHSMNSWEADHKGHCFNLVNLNGGGYRIRYFFDPSWKVLQFYRKPTVLYDWNIIGEVSGSLADAKSLSELCLDDLLKAQEPSK